MGLGGLSPPNKIIAPINKMKPISPFWLGLMLLLFHYYIFGQLKEPAAGEFFSL